MTKPRRRARWLVAAVIVVVLGLVAVGVAGGRSGGAGDGLAGEAAVSASSSALGSSPRNAVTAARGQGGARGWTSASETVGAWIELSWRSPVTIRRVTLERNALGSPGMQAGYFSFGDGSDVQVQLSTTSPTTVVPVSARTVDRLRFTVTQVAAGASSVRLARLRVEDRPQPDDVATAADPDGNAARSATVTSSEPGSRDLGALIDGNASTRTPGRTWVSKTPAPGWVQLRWSRPQELTTVAISGAQPDSGVRSGTLQFSDGSSLKVGAVLADPARPTVISFMPRVTTSLRLSVDPAPGAGPLALSELSAYQRTAPAHVLAGAQPVSAPPAAAAPCDPSGARPSDSIGLVVRCPTIGAVVDASVDLQLAVGPSYRAVDATVWSGDPTAAAAPSTRAVASSDGAVIMALDLSGVPAGPFVVQLRASSPRESERLVVLQLYRSGEVAAGPPAPTLFEGRSLVFDEEFDRGISVSRDGAGADYAAAKPETAGVSQFGDAPFADPATPGAEGPTTVGGQYLKLSAKPAPAGGFTGGLVASARPGGSGFSAQYGYFEARMMAPAAPGTWPAFWMLPTPNLVTPQPAVAEIDAVELYGHNPLGACETTHEYIDGKDGGVARCGMRWTSTRVATGWHVYGVSVAPTLISFYIDGELVATAPQVQGGDEPLFFLLNLALGGGWPVDLSRVQGRAQVYVDYVRVYV